MKHTDIVIVGSGPGGATLARELCRSQAGLSVTLLEYGRDWRRNPLYGTYPGAMLYTDKASFVYTDEGLNIIRPMMVGGATSMYCGCAERPLPWWRTQYGIELDGYAEQTIAELGIAPLPPEQRGIASTRIAEAGCELGMNWQPQDKFMQPGPGFDCGAKCMIGCRCRAKWNAASYVDEAIANGLDLWTGARVERVLIQDGQAVGVVGQMNGRPFQITADLVILCAGGIGTPLILQKSEERRGKSEERKAIFPSSLLAPRSSSLNRAGDGMTMDTTIMVYGHAPYKGIGQEPPMTWSCPDDELGVLYSTLIDPWLNYPITLLTKGPAYALTWHRWGHTLGVMIKLKDEISGRVWGNGRISKGLTPNDQERLKTAEKTATTILQKAGCDPNTLFTTPLRGTHPSGTVRIGELLDGNLQTEVKNLYLCDASVFPQALARPTVLTIIALAKRLADHLIKTSY